MNWPAIITIFCFIYSTLFILVNIDIKGSPTVRLGRAEWALFLVALSILIYRFGAWVIDLFR